MTTSTSCVLALAKTDSTVKPLKEDLTSDDPNSLGQLLEPDEIDELVSIDKTDAAAK